MLAMVERAEAQLSNIVEARAKLMQLRIIENLIDEIESRETDLDATQNRPGRNTRKMPAQDANDLLDLMNKAKALRVEIENMGYDTQTLTLDELDTQYDQLSEKRDELKQIADDLAAAERPAEVPFLTLGPVEKAATEINEATAKEIKIHIRAIDIEIARNKTRMDALAAEAEAARGAKEEAGKIREKLAGIDIGKIEAEIDERKKRLGELEREIPQLQESIDRRAAEVMAAGASEKEAADDIIITNLQHAIERKVQVIERISARLEVLEQQLIFAKEAGQLLEALDAKAQRLAEFERRIAHLKDAQAALKRHREEKVAYLEGKMPAKAAKPAPEVAKSDAGEGKKTILDKPSAEEAPKNEQTCAKEKKAVIEDYANLLRAKQRVRNALVGYKANGSKLRDAARWMLNVENDDKYLAREAEIRRNFVGLVDAGVAAAGNDRVGQRGAVKDIYGAVAERFARGRSRVDRAMMWLRKPSVTVARIAIGLGLVGATMLTGGLAAAAGVGIAIGVGNHIVGGIGRYISVDALYDKVRQKNTGKQRKGEYAVANSLMYANPDGVRDKIDAVYGGDRNISGAELDSQSMRAAKNTWINRVIKKTLAVAAAVLPPVVASWLHGHNPNPEPNPHPEPNPQPEPNPLPPVVPSSDIYVVPDNGGIWHICEKIVADKLPGFEHLSVADQNMVIDAMKDQIVADPAKFGLEPSEIIPRAIENGGPWLHKGADLIYTNSNLQDALQNWHVPKRIVDVLGMKNLATSIPVGRGALSQAAAYASHAAMRGAVVR